MNERSELRYTKLAMNNRRDIPALGFGTLIPDLRDTQRATATALEVGFRQFDCSERYRNEEAVGEALQAVLGEKKSNVTISSLPQSSGITITGPSVSKRLSRRVSPDSGSSIWISISFIRHLHFNPATRQDPRDQNGNLVYDRDVTLLDTWRAMESLVDRGKCRAIGLSDIALDELKPLYDTARIKPSVIQVEAHPYLPETELLEFCKEKGVVFLAFAPLGHGMKSGPLEDPVISAIAERVEKTPAQVLLAWAVQRGTALLTTPTSEAHARENFDISPLPEEALADIDRIQTRQRLNEVVKTGIPGFIPQGR